MIDQHLKKEVQATRTWIPLQERRVILKLDVSVRTTPSPWASKWLTRICRARLSSRPASGHTLPAMCVWAATRRGNQESHGICSAPSSFHSSDQRICTRFVQDSTHIYLLMQGDDGGMHSHLEDSLKKDSAITLSMLSKRCLWMITSLSLQILRVDCSQLLDILIK